MRTLSFVLILLGCTTALIAQHHHNKDTELDAREVSSEHSLYHLDAEWTDHRNDSYSLGDFIGKPVIAVMFYGNCTQVCPILIQDAWRLYNTLDESQRAAVTVLAITFDTENDTPKRLRQYAVQEQLDIPGWHFMTSEPASIRNLATMLGVQYSQKSDDHFAHSNLVTVLDKQGRIAKRIEGLNRPMDEAAEIIREILKRKEP